MPMDKLNQEWSENDHQQADSYTADQTSQNKSQAQIGNRPGGNRATHDPQGNGNYPSPKVKPVQPPCDGMQFAENPYLADNYLSVSYDKWGNERSEDRPMHNSGEYGDPGSIYGGRNGQDFNYTAAKTYGVQIPHGQSAAFNTAETQWVDNSAADRGPEYVEGTSDSGITGSRSRPRSDNDNVGDTSIPPIMRTRGR